jgi:hypothetical protein
MNWQTRLMEWFLPKAFAAVASAPTVFKFKLHSAYLSPDVDPVTQNNIGESTMFYLNPDCADNFGQGTDAVNQALNAQNRDINPGTYKYVRLDFCIGGTGGVPNAAWAGGNVANETYFSTGMCGVTSAVMDPPLEVAEGDSVTIRLAYDYSNSIQTGADAQGWDCVGSDAARTCFSIPDFVPSVVR